VETLRLDHLVNLSDTTVTPVDAGDLAGAAAAALTATEPSVADTY
jgi:hypothetical protein